MILITNIQRSSFHDGKGLRTTVFFKGCLLHCPWCANPETQHFESEWYFDNGKCIASNGKCVFSNCPVLQNKDISGFVCSANAINVFGKKYTPEMLLSEILKDKGYYVNGGGVTFSGGEPFLQLYKIENVLQILKEQKIHICIETCLFAPIEKVKNVLDYIDCLYIDVKILEKENCKSILGGDVELYLNNLEEINKVGKSFIFRFPNEIGMTATEKNISLISDLLQKYKPLAFEYFPIHTMAKKKYDLLNRKMYIPAGSERDLGKIKKVCEENNIQFRELHF